MNQATSENEGVNNLLPLSLAILVTATAPTFAAGKGTRFWNLTANTVTNLQLSPAGKETWGSNQCLNDKDKSVDHDERLAIKDIPSGTYDARLSDSTGRNCIVRNVEVTEGKVFSIAEKQLTQCQK
jgi:hypothetical protein